MGQKRSMCKSCMGWLVETTILDLKDALTYSLFGKHHITNFSQSACLARQSLNIFGITCLHDPYGYGLFSHAITKILSHY